MRSLAVFSVFCCIAFVSQAIAAGVTGNAVSSGASGAAPVRSSNTVSVHASSSISTHASRPLDGGGARASGNMATARRVSSTQTVSAPAARSVQLPSHVVSAAMTAVRKPCPENLARLKQTFRDTGYQQQIANSHVYCPAGETLDRGQHCVDISSVERLTRR